MADAATFGAFSALMESTAKLLQDGWKGRAPAIDEWQEIEGRTFRLRASLVDDGGLGSYLLVVLRSLEAWMPGRIGLERMLPAGRSNRKVRALVRQASDGPFMITLGAMIEQAGREAQRRGL